MENIKEKTAPLVRVKPKFQITIPAIVRSKARIKEGDMLEMKVQNNAIVVKPKVIVDRGSVEAAIAEGLKDYKAGRVHGPFKSVKEFKKSLGGK
jgi:AbrB family looped-hinge helix DNA binding protein